MKQQCRSGSRDRGFTLVELLIVIVLLGVLSGVTVFAVRGITDKGTSNSCQAELSVLRRATEAYFATYVGTNEMIATQAYAAGTGYSGNPAQSAIAAPSGVTAGATPGATLKNAGLIREVPTLMWVSPTGQIVVRNATCGTVGQPMAGDTAAGPGATAATVAPTFTGVLDGLATQPAAAYSLRKLDKDYAGAAIRVRRSSDNTTLDIGFTAAGDLDVAALSAFVGSGDGFVVTHYDQSGNGRNATQATTTRQPRVVIAGALVLINGKSAVDTAANRGVLSATTTSFTIGEAIGVVRSATTNWSGYHALASASGARNGLFMQSGATTFHNNVYPTVLRRNGAVLANNASLAPLTSAMVIDVDTTGPTVSRDRVGYGNYDVGTVGGSAIQAEVLVFPTTLSTADRATVTASMGGYYGITVV